MNSVLSILIPTYNHAEFIPKLLDSVLSQVKPYEGLIEIIVADNCSADETKDILLDYSKKYTNFSCLFNKVNIGFLGNTLKLIEASNGKYIWILGSDDWIESGAIEKIFEAIKSNDGIPGFSIGVNTYSKFENLIYKHPDNNVFYKLNGIETIYSFNDLGYKFGFISAHIIRRDFVVDAILTNPDCKNAHLVHGFITTIVAKHCYWGYFDDSLIAWRSGNDSLANNMGLYKRYLVDVDNYLHNLQTAKIPNAVVNQFINKQIVYCIRGYIIQSSMLDIPAFDIKLDSFMKFWRFIGFWKIVFPLIFTPNFIIRLLKNRRALNDK